MGSIQQLVGMIPGANKLKGLNVDERAFVKIEAIERPPVDTAPMLASGLPENPHPKARRSMGRKTYVVGVGMTKFEKPGSRDWDYPDMGREAGTKALEDAGIQVTDLDQAAVGYCYGDSTCGQRAFYELGHPGIPIYNVNNNCSTGSTALFMAKQFV